MRGCVDRTEGRRIPPSQHDQALLRASGETEYIVGAEFSAADIMLAFSFAAAQAVGVLGEQHPELLAYLPRMMSRPAFQRAVAI